MPRYKPKNSLLGPPFLKSIRCDQEALSDKKDFPYTLPFFRQSTPLSFSKPITILVGENGTGKSTLLEFIAYACGFNILGGSKNHIYETKGFESHDHLKEMSEVLKLSWLPKVSEGFFMRSESFFNFIEHTRRPGVVNLERFYGGNLFDRSHGEGVLSFFEHVLQRKGLFILMNPKLHYHQADN